MKRLTGISIGGLFLAGLLLLANTVVTIHPKLATDAVSKDPDDPALWVHSGAPNRSLILGTNKTPAPSGALLVFGLDGKIRQTISGIDRPNNVDVEYGLKLQGNPTDIAVLTERRQRRLRVFAIAADGSGLTDLSAQGLPVFVGQTGEQADPMGVALYRRPKDGTIFAIVGRKDGPKSGYLWQYRLEDDGRGKVKAQKIREFGQFSGTGEIEAIAVDDELGYVYYADESDGIHKWHADPDHPDAARELSHFGKDGFRADREGIAIYALSGGKGYIVCTDQLSGSSEYRVYRREGEPGKPHDHSTVLKVFRGGADSTDGIEISSAALGSKFPNGLMAAMNSGGRNFLIFSWEDIAKTGEPQLQLRRAKGLLP
ncbi:MAG TPA: phytase [Terriglobia bacterium]|nr:phytase [Terriglobia bacterium]